jgi:glucose-6-phosphate dehydrogenase assembly protein OpcA
MTNDTTETPGVRLPWAGKIVQMDAVEEVLSYFWRMSADNLRISQNMNVRTSVLNFIICAPDIATAQRASALLRDLSSTHIARVILLILDANTATPTSVTTWVTLRSFPIISDTMRHNFEQVTLLLSGAAIRSTATIIQPLLKPDLPVYLWWLSDPPTNDALLRKLAAMSNRIIVDSHSFYFPEDSLCTLATFLKETPRCALSDLNWGRITPWRQLVAQFFDIPDYKTHLTGVYSAELEYAIPSPGNPAEAGAEAALPNPTRALLLAGWLKKSFNWELGPGEESSHDPETGTHYWHMSRHTGLLRLHPVTTAAQPTGRLSRSGQGSITIRPRVQADIQPGALCLVRLYSLANNKHVTFTINREENADHVLTSIEQAEGTRHQRAVSIAVKQEVSELLTEELEILGHDQLYEGTLHEVFELLAD